RGCLVNEGGIESCHVQQMAERVAQLPVQAPHRRAATERPGGQPGGETAACYESCPLLRVARLLECAGSSRDLLLQASERIIRRRPEGFRVVALRLLQVVQVDDAKQRASGKQGQAHDGTDLQAAHEARTEL